ncbi:MAG TPA: glycosyltransferase family protein [Cyclobacteriaceae bacterium]|nr:glycosyltransferase family protein [Cyclobacteriaceae bacterium]
MKILYAIQGTGNGHLSRAVDIIPELKRYGDIDLMVSGAQSEIKLPFAVKYKSKGLSFHFGKHGGINFYNTLIENSSRDVLKEIKTFPIEKYDLVVNDFEPITAWAAHRKDVRIVGLSHQSAMLSKKTPKPRIKDPFGEWVLKNYAPVKDYIGFHFDEYDKNIFKPVVRKAIREVKATDKGHYTVYLPAYDDKKLVALLMKLPSLKWHIFSKHTQVPYHVGKISVYPVSGDDFVASMVSSHGVLCGAGFETPAEVLYLNKKLLVVPMKNQYEQACNAAALKKLGVPVLKRVKKRSLKKIEKWLDSAKTVSVDYGEVAPKAVDRLMKKFGND